MSNCSKCKVKKKEDLIGCEGPCDRWWHYSCVKISDSEFKFLSKHNNVIYLCDDCKNKGAISIKQSDSLEDVYKKIEDFAKTIERSLDNKLSLILKQVNEQFTLLRQEVSDIVSSSESSQAFNNANDHPTTSTNASALKSTPTVIITPKDTSQSSNTTKAQIYHNVDPVKENVIIKKVKNVRNGGIAVQCENGDSFTDLINSKLSNNYDVKVINALNPRIRISGISEKLDKEIIVDMLKSQNKCLFHSGSHLKLVSISPLRKNQNMYQATVDVDSETYHKFIKHEHVVLGYDYCKVYDAIDVRRCFKCCGFHHLASKCTSEMSVCPRCSENHPLAECNSSNLKCIHCHNYNARNSDNKLRTDHAVWDRSCKIYELVLNNLKSRILDTQ